jgi:hypothetical protein
MKAGLPVSTLIEMPAFTTISSMIQMGGGGPSEYCSTHFKNKGVPAGLIHMHGGASNRTDPEAMYQRAKDIDTDLFDRMIESVSTGRSSSRHKITPRLKRKPGEGTRKISK